MAQGGGKPGFVVKGYVMAEPNSGQIVVTPKSPDQDLWKYFAEAGTSEFVIQFLYSERKHNLGGPDESKDA